MVLLGRMAFSLARVTTDWQVPQKVSSLSLSQVTAVLLVHQGDWESMVLGQAFLEFAKAVQQAFLAVQSQIVGAADSL